MNRASALRWVRQQLVDLADMLHEVTGHRLVHDLADRGDAPAVAIAFTIEVGVGHLAEPCDRAVHHRVDPGVELTERQRPIAGDDARPELIRGDATHGYRPRSA